MKKNKKIIPIVEEGPIDPNKMIMGKKYRIVEKYPDEDIILNSQIVELIHKAYEKFIFKNIENDLIYSRPYSYLSHCEITEEK
jgi:hypothetical protein